MANLILWRHADAEDDSATGLDADRALSKQGRKDARRMADWLDQFLPQNTTILSSPAKRCLETVAALPQLNPNKTKRQVQVVDYLSIDNTVADMRRICSMTTISKRYWWWVISPIWAY